jgi:hypothetical protein
MNLQPLKRNFGKTNPEKGLRSLPGCHKGDHKDDKLGTIRVSGKYIPSDHDALGLAFGFLGYTIAWISVISLVINTFLVTTSSDGDTNYVIASFVLGCALVHGCAIFADTMRNTEAPWTRKGIIVFWSGVLLSVVLGLIL